MPDRVELMEHLAGRVRAAFEAADLSPFADLLDPHVHWGPPGSTSPPCRTRDQVISWYRREKEAGARARVLEALVLGDRILIGLRVSGARTAHPVGAAQERWQVLTVGDGRIVDIVGFEQRDEAVACATTSSVPSEPPAIPG